jgi:hypothetical protein
MIFRFFALLRMTYRLSTFWRGIKGVWFFESTGSFHSPLLLKPDKLPLQRKAKIPPTPLIRGLFLSFWGIAEES